MLLLLPPSEGKTAPRRGRPVDLSTLSHPGLADARAHVLAALAEASSRPDALALLGAPAGAAAEVGANVALTTAPAAASHRVYSGVLYEAAGWADLGGSALRRAGRAVRTVSALWGLVAPGDHIPAYRLSMGVALPGTGPLASWWRPRLAAELDAQTDGRLVVDCRSAAYLAAWRPPRGAVHVSVRVERLHDGRRTVVSHDAKRWRGLLTGHLLRRPEPLPHDVAGLAAAAGGLVGQGVHDVETTTAAGRAQLTLVTD